MRAPAALVLDHVRVPVARRQLAALGLLALVIAVLGALRLSDLREEEQSLQAQYKRSASITRAAPQPARETTPPVLAPAPPWDRIFGALEMAGGGDVGLLAFDPTPDRRQLRIEGEARNLQALLDYMRRVGAASPFIVAELQNHQVSRGDPQRPVRFMLDLTWRAAP